MSNYDDMRSLIESISGQASVITILRLYVDIFDDLDTAAVVSQVVFWSDRGTIEDGWFYKSRADWQKSIGIKRSALDSAIKRANSKAPGLIQTKTRPARGNSPTLFYRLDMDIMTRLVVEHLKIRFAEINKSTNGRSVEINKSDMLKSTSPLVEINTSSFISLKQNITSEAINAPAEPKKPKSSKAPDPLLQHPAVVVYRDVMHLTPNDVQRAMIAERIGDNGRLDDWRALLIDWKAHNWRPGNIPGMVEKFEKENGQHANTTKRTTEPQYTPEQLAAAERINAARAAKHAANG
jgi:hypothetical protein